MSSLIALGFYATHPEIMDLLSPAESFEVGFDEYCEEAGVPEELKDAVNNHIDILNEWSKRLEHELGALEADLMEELKKRADAGAARVQSFRKPYWGGHIWLTKEQLAKTAKVQLGWRWKTRENKLYLEPWLWSEGRRRAESPLADVIKRWSSSTFDAVAAGELSDEWSSGVVRLASIEVTSLVGEGFALSKDSIKESFSNCFSWVTEKALAQVFEIVSGLRSS